MHEVCVLRTQRHPVCKRPAQHVHVRVHGLGLCPGHSQPGSRIRALWRPRDVADAAECGVDPAAAACIT